MHVRPLLVKHCISCHGPAKAKANLRLDTKAGWQTSGDSGPAILPGKAAASLLMKALRATDGIEQMPPKGPLPEREIALLAKWIDAGAADPRTGGVVRLGGTTLAEAKRWWAFQPVKRPTVPGDGNANPVDAFLAAKRASHKLTAAPPAEIDRSGGG